MQVYPTLYSIDKKNLIREWEIKVVNRDTFTEIITIHGVKNGKKTTKIVKVENGKNHGKKNETNHYQQALLDAKSKWVKKKDTENYLENLQENVKNSQENESEKNKSNENHDKPGKPEKYLPMLAYEYKKYSKKLSFPCFIQRKYDGYRMLFNNNTSDMYTRSGKKYTILYNTEIHKQLIDINLPLDGELYCHDSEFTFESYGLLRKKKLTEKDKELLKKLEYHVYDINIPNVPFVERYKILKNALKDKTQTQNIKLVESFVCNNKDEIDQYHKSFVESKYEGSILRNYAGMYASKRSFDLLKYKDFDDDEFEITDFTTEKDNDIDLIVWICKTKDGKTFNIRPQGTKEERESLFNKGKEFIGQKLWVKYFGLTENKIPRFPSTKTNSFNSYIRNEE